MEIIPTIDKNELARLLGSDEFDTISCSTLSKIQRLETVFEEFVDPSLYHQNTGIDSVEKGTVHLEEGPEFKSPKLSKMLESCDDIICYVITLGDGIDREIKLVNKQHGFAGTADVLFRYGRNGIGILDYKTRKTKPGEEVTAYDNQAMQLAAYGATYWGEENLGRLLAANVFISTTEPGRVVVVKHPDVVRDWQAFRMVAALWRYIKGYDPRQHAPA